MFQCIYLRQFNVIYHLTFCSCQNSDKQRLSSGVRSGDLPPGHANMPFLG